MNNVELQGGCHCRAVRFQITGLNPESGYCHCRDCQQTSGAPAQVWMSVKREDFRLTAGTPTAYESSKNGRRNFCGDCGSQLFFAELSDPDHIYPNAGCLDDPNLVKPQMHIWTDSQLGWFKLNDHLPRFAKDAPEDQ